MERKIKDIFTLKRHYILPDIEDPKDQLLKIWTPEDRKEVYKSENIHSIQDSEETKYDLSIIIPVYNTEKYLRKCLWSVLSQECSYKIQIIVVNDGSTDDSEKVLKQFQRLNFTGKYMQIITQENGGLSAARNTGLYLAKGKYLMFLDSDDSLKVDCIQKAMPEIIRQNADFVQLQYCIKLGQKIQAGTHIPEGIYTDYSAMCQIPGYATMKIFRASLFDDIKFPENYWFEDSIIHFCIYPKCQKAIVLPDIGYVYLKNTHGITQSRDGKNRSIETILVVDKIILLENEPKGYMDELIRQFTFLSYNRLKYLPERTIQLAFLTACTILENVKQLPSDEYLELYTAYKNRDYGIWKWYATGKGGIL